jgi:hypothetical protein
MRESPRQPFQFGKYPVAMLVPDAGQCAGKKSVIFHFSTWILLKLPGWPMRRSLAERMPPADLDGCLPSRLLPG